MRVLAYTDNLNITHMDNRSVERVLQHFQAYEAAMGAKLNVSRSTCLPGELRDLLDLGGVSVPWEGAKLLRMKFRPRADWTENMAKD